LRAGRDGRRRLVVPLSEQRKRYLEANKEKVKAQQKVRSDLWYERNKELAKARGKAAYDADPIGFKEKHRVYHQRTRPARLLKGLEYRRSNAATVKAADKAWRASHKDHIAAKDKEYRIKNAEHVKQIQKQWKQRNKARVRLSILKRKALKKKASVNLAGMKEWMGSVLSKPFAKCYYCDKKISTRGIHFDHIIPLIEGGQHSVENLCVSCPECNLSKSRKPITIWAKPGQQILAL
jgi:5-methylcytosine-specific restriction endonuclease McrA